MIFENLNKLSNINNSSLNSNMNLGLGLNEIYENNSITRVAKYNYCNTKNVSFSRPFWHYLSENQMARNASN